MENCNTTGSSVFTLDRWGERMEYLVCDFHGLMLREERNIEVSDDRSLRTGSQTSPEVLNVRYVNSMGRGKTLVLVLGNDGVETGELEVRVTRELVGMLQSENLLHFLGVDRSEE